MLNNGLKPFHVTSSQVFLHSLTRFQQGAHFNNNFEIVYCFWQNINDSICSLSITASKWLLGPVMRTLYGITYVLTQPDIDTWPVIFNPVELDGMATSYTFAIIGKVANMHQNRSIVDVPMIIYYIRLYVLLRVIYAILRWGPHRGWLVQLMPRPHHTLGPRASCSCAVHGPIWKQKSYVYSWGPCGAVGSLPLHTGVLEYWYMQYNASVTSNHGPRTTFSTPTIFLTVRPNEVSVGILCWCCFRGHIRLWAPYGLSRLYAYGLIE